MVQERIICAGFGGQGVMSMGQLISYAGMIEGKNVSWLPSYGPEMRGGTANCNVTVSDTPIGSPIIAHNATAAIVMNLPSLIKFEKELEKDGILLINSSLIEKKAERDDIRAFYIPANEIAVEIGNTKVANMVMLGAYIQLTKIVKPESIIQALRKVFGPSKEHLIPLNEEALKRGAEMVKA
ncbi:2-oxoglutarate ferredoxin oxidoreductase subunit gamma [Caminicella sporogenes DSM 14501]|uniref:2-oxoglutarate ferredoxin oxidoreductase subunit gamma n=1 Tax=Caminicella sporogenes DSM 14501 TaxID=1121266 RepID=A0A1M6PIT3_9FIRM|nr:2-oxoacid:acceptor oxidoreductase family protein [Caminicella sporogenes]RKD21386.1 2-oxoacid:ferredoxin oxidoreductase subunit gamma [Caminicella sporogenes]WIF95481.1 2-oxoacid:acceptor oxidoreductase family protein [Caminicella sporogenes]SHK07848.1 2-oxoglutarate ferredoxin oxidoreductase subunit gamma [Caminicella sporogenes DSM 14501]